MKENLKVREITMKKSNSIGSTNKKENSIGMIWIIITIMLSILPFLFSTLLTYFGENWNLIKVTQNKNGVTSRGLSSWGIFVTLAMVIIICILTFYVKHKEFHSDKYNKQLEIKEGGYNLFDMVLNAVGQICKRKYSRQMKTIVDIKQNGKKPPKIYTKPCDQLEEILSELCNCITYVLSEQSRRFNRNDIYASIAYNFPLENPNVWQWSNVKNEQGLSIDKLTENNTTFSYLMKNATEKSPSVFFNSKQEAYEKGCYQPDECDKYDTNHKLKGSIACFKINLKRLDKTYITAVLGISSYEKQFVDVSNKVKEQEKINQQIENIYKNIENVIVAELSERIKIELCNYYLQYLLKKWKQTHSKNFVTKPDKSYITL